MPVDEGRHGPRRIPEDRSEGFGERLLGQLLDRSHELPPQLIAPLVAEEVARIGGRDVSVRLQDYALITLVPLPGRGLTVGEPIAIDGSPEGEAFLGRRMVEESQADGVRVHVPLVMVLTRSACCRSPWIPWARTTVGSCGDSRP
ncbi:hypothetical protein [Streptomyces sp. NBRC 110028]|uniref:hypothetical protein n=1 Tax=Streptomyces sp. NBRC 110028 TaxID=1621260 RepID=UPI00351C3F61